MVVYILEQLLLSKTSTSKEGSNLDLPEPETDSHGNVIGDLGPLITTLEDPQ
jgi:hypothetical protein